MTDATAREARKPGWYFIREASGWFPARWDGQWWNIDGFKYGARHSTILEIDERPIERPRRAAGRGG